MMEKSNEALTKRDVLEWLEMQRDAINTEIAYAAPDDKRQYFGNLKIVNWLTERVKAMSAVEYLEAREQICDKHYQPGDCAPACPFAGWVCGSWRTERGNPRRAVEIVKRWKEEQDGND